jgi:hypothetical protein
MVNLIDKWDQVVVEQVEQEALVQEDLDHLLSHYLEQPHNLFIYQIHLVQDQLQQDFLQEEVEQVVLNHV